jgi:ribonuclease HI
MLPATFSSLKATKMKVIPETIFYHMNFDGCSKGNPGLAGAGAVIYDENHKEVWSGSLFVGKSITNNYAEYYGLLMGMEKAVEMNIKSLVIRGDSQLVINHMTGKYKCKSINLVDLYSRAKELDEKFDAVHYFHVLREYNKRADELSNIPVQEYHDNNS